MADEFEKGPVADVAKHIDELQGHIKQAQDHPDEFAKEMSAINEKLKSDAFKEAFAKLDEDKQAALLQKIADLNKNIPAGATASRNPHSPSPTALALPDSKALSEAQKIDQFIERVELTQKQNTDMANRNGGRARPVYEALNKANDAAIKLAEEAKASGMSMADLEKQIEETFRKNEKELPGARRFGDHIKVNENDAASKEGAIHVANDLQEKVREIAEKRTPGNEVKAVPPRVVSISLTKLDGSGEIVPPAAPDAPPKEPEKPAAAPPAPGKAKAGASETKPAAAPETPKETKITVAEYKDFQLNTNPELVEYIRTHNLNLKFDSKDPAKFAKQMQQLTFNLREDLQSNPNKNLAERANEQLKAIESRMERVAKALGKNEGNAAELMTAELKANPDTYGFVSDHLKAHSLKAHSLKLDAVNPDDLKLQVDAFNKKNPNAYASEDLQAILKQRESIEAAVAAKVAKAEAAAPPMQRPEDPVEKAVAAIQKAKPRTEEGATAIAANAKIIVDSLKEREKQGALSENEKKLGALAQDLTGSKKWSQNLDETKIKDLSVVAQDYRQEYNAATDPKTLRDQIDKAHEKIHATAQQVAAADMGERTEANKGKFDQKVAELEDRAKANAASAAHLDAATHSSRDIAQTMQARQYINALGKTAVGTPVEIVPGSTMLAVNMTAIKDKPAASVQQGDIVKVTRVDNQITVMGADEKAVAQGTIVKLTIVEPMKDAKGAPIAGTEKQKTVAFAVGEAGTIQVPPPSVAVANSAAAGRSGHS